MVDVNNKKQANIIANKLFYQAIAQIMSDLEKRGYKDLASEATKIIKAYHSIVNEEIENNFNKNYNEAFKKIDESIKNIGEQFFQDYEEDKFDMAYSAFKDFDYTGVIGSR